MCSRLDTMRASTELDEAAKSTLLEHYRDAVTNVARASAYRYEGRRPGGVRSGWR
ncbi:MAG: hypothetical protein WDZ60_07835 [Wenzhouxiangellaceae bacterium]